MYLLNRNLTESRNIKMQKVLLVHLKQVHGYDVF